MELKRLKRAAKKARRQQRNLNRRIGYSLMQEYKQQIREKRFPDMKVKKLRPILLKKMQYKGTSKGVIVGYNAKFNLFANRDDLSLTHYMEYGGTRTGVFTLDLNQLTTNKKAIIIRKPGHRLNYKENLFATQKGQNILIWRRFKRRVKLVAVVVPSAVYHRQGRTGFYDLFNREFDDIVDEKTKEFYKKLLPAIL